MQAKVHIVDKSEKRLGELINKFGDKIIPQQTDNIDLMYWYKFSKFINRLRTRFSHLFSNLLEIQLVLKGNLTRNDWRKIKNEIYYDFPHDNYFTELKQAEVLRERLGLANEIDEYVGKYYSLSWVRKNVLQMTEEEIRDMDKEIKKEESDEDSPMDTGQSD